VSRTGKDDSSAAKEKRSVAIKFENFASVPQRLKKQKVSQSAVIVISRVLPVLEAFKDSPKLPKTSGQLVKTRTETRVS
jgi:hypothetical protein